MKKKTKVNLFVVLVIAVFVIGFYSVLELWQWTTMEDQIVSREKLL
jgi:hypothetical protein